MKGLKKLALATAVAAAPFAQAEMTAMDDALLGEMTGQAGVTIELDTAVTIASMTYTDTDGHSSGTAGTIVMNNIAFGGAAVSGLANSQQDARFDDIKIDIDVDGDDGLVIHLIGTDTKNALLGVNPVDFGLSVGDVKTNGLTGNLASGINIAGNLGPIDIVIGDSVDNALTADITETIGIQAYFEVTDGAMDLDVIGLGISNLRVGQDSSPLINNGQGINKNYRSEILLVNEVAATVNGTAQAQAAEAEVLAQESLTGLDRADAGFAAAVGSLSTADQTTVTNAGIAADNFVRTDDATLTTIMTQVINGGPGAAASAAVLAGMSDADATTAARGIFVTTAGQNAADAWVEVGTSGVDAGGVSLADTRSNAETTAAGTFDGQSAADQLAAGESYRDGVAAATAAGTTAAVNPNNVTNMAFVDMVIGNGTSSYYSLKDNQTVLVDAALTVELKSFNIDVSMDLSMGSISKDDGVTYQAASIGSIALDDLDLSGTKLVIYGH